MPLTDTAIRTAKPDRKILKIYDEPGLYLEISSAWKGQSRFEDYLGEIRARIGNRSQVANNSNRVSLAAFAVRSQSNSRSLAHARIATISFSEGPLLVR